MKINSKTFYKNHLNEINRYYSKPDSVLHIVNKISSLPELKDITDTIQIDIGKEESIFANKSQKKYDLVVITDLFELSDDIYLFLKKITQFLEPSGKLLITSINPKWNNLIKVFELLRLKNITKRRNYIHPKKINNIAKSTGLELIHKNTRQIIPFSLFGIGNILNKIL